MFFRKKLKPTKSEIDFPAEFDHAFYREHHADLSDMSESELVEHYERYGQSEGRMASQLTVREAFLDALSDASSVLELGPGPDPVFRGKHVEYFDLAPQSVLVEQFAGSGEDAARIPKIDYADAQGQMTVVEKSFNLVFSSHWVQRQPDLIHHLNSVAGVLNPGGLYAFCAPDHRYCFDALRSASTLGEIFQAHIENRRSARLCDRIDQLLLATHNDPVRHWDADHGTPNGTPRQLQGFIDGNAPELAKNFEENLWQLTPSSLRTALDWHFEIERLDLEPYRIYDTPRGRLEFMVVLRKP